MTSTLPKGTLGSVASLYRGHHNTNHIALVINYEPNVYLISKKEIKLKNRNLYKMCIIEAQLPVFINFFTNSETSSKIIVLIDIFAPSLFVNW
jgi:thiamine kinase-like enzyme